jgi:dienelactone hydrolase
MAELVRLVRSFNSISSTLTALPKHAEAKTGMCLGGHLAYRCALDPRVLSAVCYFATDIHSATLGAGKSDDSLKRVKDIKGELVMIFGKMDNHVPPEGRDLIRKTLHEAGVTFSFYEPAWAQRKSSLVTFSGVCNRIVLIWGRCVYSR